MSSSAKKDTVELRTQPTERAGARRSAVDEPPGMIELRNRRPQYVPDPQYLVGVRGLIGPDRPNRLIGNDEGMAGQTVDDFASLANDVACRAIVAPLLADTDERHKSVAYGGLCLDRDHMLVVTEHASSFRV